MKSRLTSRGGWPGSWHAAVSAQYSVNLRMEKPTDIGPAGTST
jgi:hypothetical protein